MNYDAYGNPIKPKSSGVLVPIVLALLVSAGGNYWLYKERARLSAEAFTATAKLAAAEAVQRETTEKVAQLQVENAALGEAKEQAIKDAQAKATELAKLKDDVAGVAGTNEPEGDAKADDKSKGDSKAAKDSDAKPDAKSSKSKSKDKDKAKKKSSSHRKEKDSGSAKPSGEL